jgi:hypothetical protein
MYYELKYTGEEVVVAHLKVGSSIPAEMAEEKHANPQYG